MYIVYISQRIWSQLYVFNAFIYLHFSDWAKNHRPRPRMLVEDTSKLYPCTCEGTDWILNAQVYSNVIVMSTFHDT